MEIFSNNNKMSEDEKMRKACRCFVRNLNDTSGASTCPYDDSEDKDHQIKKEIFLMKDKARRGRARDAKREWEEKKRKEFEKEFDMIARSLMDEAEQEDKQEEEEKRKRKTIATMTTTTRGNKRVKWDLLSVVECESNDPAADRMFEFTMRYQEEPKD